MRSKAAEAQKCTKWFGSEAEVLRTWCLGENLARSCLFSQDLACSRKITPSVRHDITLLILLLKDLGSLFPRADSQCVEPSRNLRHSSSHARTGNSLGTSGIWPFKS